MGAFDHNLAVIIGINDYKNDKLENLETAKHDAKRLASILEKNHDYKSIILMTDDDNEPPTQKKLLDLLENKLSKEIKITDKDRLLFYFAGHGTKRDSDTEPAGYLVPQDGDIDNISTLLDMKTLLECLTNLPCRHLLLIFDCCFGGAIRWEVFRKGTTAPQNFYQEHYQQYTQAKAWQVITSSTYKEEALDSFRDTRGQQPGTKHSPFAHFLFKALEDGEADRFGKITGDGVITATELYLYLRYQVQKSSKLSQTPQLFPLKNHESGEYIFELPDFKLDNLKAAPELDPKNNPYRGLNAFDEEDAQFFFGRKELKEELCKKVSSSSSNLTIVLGASGSGKSSLVKAGLIPCLREQTQQKWRILNPMRPGEAPFNELAITIASLIDVSFSTQELTKLSFLSQELQNKKAELEIHKDSKIKRLREKYKSIQNISTLWDSDDNQAKSKIIVENYQELYELLSKPNADQHIQSSQQKILKDIVFQGNEKLYQNLKNSSQYFIDFIKKWSQQHPQEHLLLVIDQFEELITLNQNSQQGKQKNKKQQGLGNEQEEFLNLLKQTLEANLSQVHIVLTLRSDFEPRFLTAEAFASHWKNARFQVRGMRTDELREAIEQPANEMALEFDPKQPGLVDNLIDEVSQMPGALPLLSFALSELYIDLYKSNIGKNTSDRILKLEDKFAQQGGVIGSLTRKANEVYNQLDDAHDQATMRRVMLRMVTIEGGESARRRVPRSELIYSDSEENERVKKVIDTLSEARLIVHGTNSESKPCVEPAHDALVKGWDQLQKWKKEDEQSLFLQQRLIPASNDWYDLVKEEQTQNKKKLFQLPEALWKLPVHFYGATEALVIDKYQSFQRQRQRKKIQQSKNYQANSNSKSKDRLWNNDPRLKQLNQVIDSENDWLNQIEDDFVKKSSIEKGRGNFRWTIGASFVVLILFSLGGLATWGYIESLKGQIRTNRETAEAKLKLKPDLDALIDILRSVNISRNPIFWLFGRPDAELAEVRETLFKTLYTVKERNRFQLDTSSVYGVTFNPLTKQIAIAGDKGTVRIYDASGSNIVSQFPSNVENLRGVAFNSKGDLLAVSGDKSVKLWKIKDDGTVDFDSSKNLPLINTKLKGTLRIVFNSKNNELAIVGDDNDDKKVELWELKKDTQEKLTDDQKNISNKELGKSKTIYDAAFSPDGKLLATVGKNDEITLWDMSSYEPLKSFNTKQGEAYSVVFSPDTKQLATGGENGQVKLWNITKEEKDSKITIKDVKCIKPTSPDNDFFKQTKNLPTAKQNIFYKLAFSSDGKQLAAITEQDIVTLWGVENEKVIEKIQPPEDSIQGIAVKSMTFSNDGERVAAIAEDNTVRLWNIAGEQIIRFSEDGRNNSVAFRPTDENRKIRQLAIANNSEVKLLDENGLLLKQLPLSNVNSLIFSPKGDQLVTVQKDDTITTWNVEDTNKKVVFKKISSNKLPEEVASIAIAPNGKQLATIGKDHKINLWHNTGKVWDNRGKLKTELKDFQMPQGSDNIAFSPDGKLLATPDDKNKVILWYNSSGNKYDEYDEFDTYQGQVSSVAFVPSKDQLLLATGGKNGTVKLWDVLSNKLPRFLTQEGTRFALAPKGKLLATVEENGKIKLWDIKDDGLPQTRDITKTALNEFQIQSKDCIDKNPIKPDCVFLSPDLQKLAIATIKDNETVVSIWDTQGNYLTKFTTEQKSLKNVQFSDDTKSLITLGDDQKIKLWEIQENQNNQQSKEKLTVQPINLKKLNPELSQLKIDQLAFSPDGKRFATAEATAETPARVKVWNRNTTKQSIEIEGNFQTQQRKVVSMAFNPDGKQLAIAGEDKTLRLWDTKGKLITKDFQTDNKEISHISFDPDNSKLLATVAEDSKFKVWDTSGNLVFAEEENPSTQQIAFDSDGKHLITFENSGRVRLWQVGGVDELFTHICSLVGNYLENNPKVIESDRHLCQGVQRVNSKGIQPPNELVEEPTATSEPSPTPMTPLQAIAGDFFGRAEEQINENPISKKPNNINDYINRGITYYRLRNKYSDKNYIELAIKDYTTALGMSPTKSQSVQAYVNKGIAYSTRSNPGDQELAIKDYNIAININTDPKYVDVYISRGIAYSALGNHDQAIKDYKDAIGINDKNANAYYALGFTLALLQGKEQEAIAAYEKAAELYKVELHKASYLSSTRQRIKEMKTKLSSNQ